MPDPSSALSLTLTHQFSAQRDTSDGGKEQEARSGGHEKFKRPTPAPSGSLVGPKSTFAVETRGRSGIGHEEIIRRNKHVQVSDAQTVFRVIFFHFL